MPIIALNPDDPGKIEIICCFYGGTYADTADSRN